MATTAQNTMWQPILPGQITLPVNGANTVNAGDLVFWDASTTPRSVKVITTDAQALSSIGVAQDSNPVSSNIGVTAIRVTVQFNSIFKFSSTSGDTYRWFDPLFIGADSQTLTNVAATNILARMYLPFSDTNGNALDSNAILGASGTIIYGIVKPLMTTLGIL